MSTTKTSKSATKMPSLNSKDGPKKKIHPVDSTLLDTFWNLSVEDENTRFNACEKLIQILQLKSSTPRPSKDEKDEDDEEENKELMYTLKRLIRGLASNRQWACPGFAMALTQVLRMFPSISVSQLLKLSDSEFTVGTKDTKQDRTGIYRAQVMVYLCLVQSDIVKNASNSDIGKIMNSLLQIRQERNFLQQLCIHTISQISSKVSQKIFTKAILPLLNEELTLGWKNCKSADSLLLLILISRSQPTVINEKFMREHWNGSSILVEHNFKYLAEIMMNSWVNKPPMHSVCVEILRTALQSDIFEKFWNSVVAGTMISDDYVKNKHLALQLVSQALELNPSANQIKRILKPEIRDMIVTNIASSKLALHPVAKKLNDDILKYVRNTENVETQKAAVKCLLHGNVQYDSITQSKTIHHILLALKPEAAQWFSEKCMELFHDENIFGEQKSDVSDVCNWAGSQLTLLCSHLPTEQQRKVIKFLFLHSFFLVNKTSADILHCEKMIPPQTINSKLQHMLKDSFAKALHGMTSVHHQGEGQLKHFTNNMENLFDIIQYGQELLDSSKIVSLRKQWSDEAKEEWQNMYKAVQKIIGKVEHDKSINDNHAFGMLFLHLGLQLLTDEQHAIDGLQDLHICYQKAFHKRRKSVAKNDDADGQEWIEVITDLFLSLLSLNSNLIRNAVNDVFGLLSSHMTPSSVKLIIDVLTTEKPDEEDDGVLAFEEEDMNVDSGNENESLLSDPSSVSVDDTPEPKEEDDDESDADDEDDSDVSEDSDIEEDIDVNFRETVKAALGSAAADSEKEESDEEDFDDEAMFRVDDALAEAFRSMSKGKRKKEEEEKKQQVMQYKMRCLDLLTMLIKNDDTAPCVLLEMVIPLLNLISYGAKDVALKKLCEKSTNVFRHLCKHKTLVKLSHEDRDRISSMIKQLLKPSGLPPYEISNGCAFLIKLLSQSPETAKTRGQERRRDDELQDTNVHSIEIMDVLRSALKDFMEKRDSHLNHLLFNRMMSNHPIFLWPLSKDLLTYITDADVRLFCRTQACTMLKMMVTKTVMEAMKPKWKDFFSELSKHVNAALENSLAESEIKPKYLIELLSCYMKTVLTTERTNVVLKLDENIKSNVEKLKAIPSLKKDVRKICDRILKLQDTLIACKRKRKLSQTETNGGDTSVGIPTEDQPDSTEITNQTPKSSKKNRKRKSESSTESSANICSEISTSPKNETSKTPKSSKKKKNGEENVKLDTSSIVLESPLPKTQGKKHKTPKSLKKTDETNVTPSIENGNSEVEIPVKTPKSSKKSKHLGVKCTESQLENVSINGNVEDVSVKTPKPSKTKTPKSTKTPRTPKSSKI
ncbi:myb-binding protein 1A-like protein [Tubulanus polymorphus]|uniref:myb-binding protein 1A-like protein n=1 Tax=Tubulanus polymorphus TaxID=672921 RepID=UPI003DA44B32